MLVRTDDEGVVRILTLNRVEKRNSFNSQLLADLVQALSEAIADPGVSVVVLTGDGPTFSAGADLAEMSGTAPLTEATRRGRNSKDYFDELIALLTDMSKPLIVAVNGAAAGFGLTILCFADLVFMSSTARLRCPFTEFGLAPEAASSYLLPMLIGRQNAAWILLSSEWISADDALRMGLAWQVCEPDELMQTTLAHATVLGSRSALSLEAVKRAMLAPHRDETAAAHAREMAAFSQLMPRFRRRE